MPPKGGGNLNNPQRRSWGGTILNCRPKGGHLCDSEAGLYCRNFSK